MAKFQSRCPNQVLCMKPARNSIIDGIVVPVPGEHVRFENGEFSTTDKKKIEYIKGHRLFGTSIVEVTKVDEQDPSNNPPKE